MYIGPPGCCSWFSSLLSVNSPLSLLAYPIRVMSTLASLRCPTSGYDLPFTYSKWFPPPYRHRWAASAFPYSPFSFPFTSTRFSLPVCLLYIRMHMHQRGKSLLPKKEEPEFLPSFLIFIPSAFHPYSLLYLRHTKNTARAVSASPMMKRTLTAVKLRYWITNGSPIASISLSV